MVKASVLALALALAGAANAYITGIAPQTTPFQVTDNSRIPITFTTDTHPTTRDYSIAIGIAPVSDTQITEGDLGEEILRVFNLIHRHQDQTGPGSFTVQANLTRNQVPGGQPGQFYITAAVTGGAGALQSTTVRFFNETVQLQF